jgi:hypothetical protein
MCDVNVISDVSMVAVHPRFRKQTLFTVYQADRSVKASLMSPADDVHRPAGHQRCTIQVAAAGEHEQSAIAYHACT